MRLAALVLMVLLLSNVVLRPLVTITSFVIHQDEIAEELCENRMQPELLCNGKCYLKKELAKQFDDSNQEDEPAQTPLEELKFTLYFHEDINFEFLEKVQHEFHWKAFDSNGLVELNTPPPIFV